MTFAKSSLSIYNLLEANAKKNPENIAIVAAQQSPLTYSGLFDAVTDVVNKLNTLGVGRNDRVAVALPNGPEMAVAFLGIASCATCAPLNPNYRESEYDFYLSDLDAKALIFQSGVAEAAVEVARKRGIPLVELSPIKQAAAGIFQLTVSEAKNPTQSTVAQSEDVALVLHTSGTTSRPKMVPLTHNNLCTSAENISSTLNLTKND
ncbi:MAG: AMP-binding protein, partial [Cyanobacteria bacterium J06649_11]